MSQGRILGVDYGERRVGLALSDPLGLTAQPLAQVERRDDAGLAGAIGLLLEPHEVERVVVGVPLGLSGADSAQTKRTRRFIALLRRSLPVPVQGWDERLSTAHADQALAEMQVKPSRRAERRDMMAAQLILQGYLDRRRAAASRP
ncbi:MAG: Holliday junction resolvase RuvX [Candidatus Tectomicrobia bacterium]|uniref:Putative pre-16S rRNA nuclease n=1 Tax=Tectimicrobiota bacterium TaxID=2528274 RepID=A0A932HZ27_UNCTE|nr:Holliday junction resolvase RuvX [Candidatus Tectomicrobia bacterium]